MLIVQTPMAPAAVRNAFADLLDNTATEVRIASAYVTMQGSKMLFDCLAEFLDERQIDTMPKLLVASLDFGLTEPHALSFWSKLPNSTVRVAGAKSVARGSLLPTQAYHPKVYAFGFPRRANMLIGSANLTSRGLTINSEAMWAQRNVRPAILNKTFADLSAGTELLTSGLLSDYRALRKKKPPPKELKKETARVPRPDLVSVSELSTFREVVESGTIVPSSFREFWVQSKGVQGGAENQLELPRQGHRFFGSIFNNYAYPKKTTISTVDLCAGASLWSQRLLTWHGDNKMERINLPTRAQGGFQYSESVVKFRRLQDGTFELMVEPWNSDLAHAWRRASAANSLVFRLGQSANSRVVGLIP